MDPPLDLNLVLDLDPPPDGVPRRVDLHHLLHLGSQALPNRPDLRGSGGPGVRGVGYGRVGLGRVGLGGLGQVGLSRVWVGSGGLGRVGLGRSSWVRLGWVGQGRGGAGRGGAGTVGCGSVLRANQNLNLFAYWLVSGPLESQNFPGV